MSAARTQGPSPYSFGTFRTTDRNLAARLLKALRDGRPLKLLGVQFQVTSVDWVEQPAFLADIVMVEVRPLISAKS